MKRFDQKLKRARSIPGILALLYVAPHGSETRQNALKKMYVVAKRKIEQAKTELQCMKILESTPFTCYEKKLRRAAIQRMFSIGTYDAYKCACILADEERALEAEALRGMLATAKTVEEFAFISRFAPDDCRDIRFTAEHHLTMLRGEIHDIPE